MYLQNINLTVIGIQNTLFNQSNQFMSNFNVKAESTFIECFAMFKYILISWYLQTHTVCQFVMQNENENK